MEEKIKGIEIISRKKPLDRRYNIQETFYSIKEIKDYAKEYYKTWDFLRKAGFKIYKIPRQKDEEVPFFDEILGKPRSKYVYYLAKKRKRW